MQDNDDSLDAVCSVLPMLAYGDISQEAWQDLQAGDCIHFIQLAQRAVRNMLSEADAAHLSLVRRSATQQDGSALDPLLLSMKCAARLRLQPGSVICISRVSCLLLNPPQDRYLNAN